MIQSRSVQEATAQLLPLLVKESRPNLQDSGEMGTMPKCPPVTTLFLDAMREFLHNPATAEAFRANPNNFTKDKCFCFPPLVISILKSHGMPAQARLKRLFNEGAFGNYGSIPTASGFCQARVKVQATFFQAWAEKAVQFFYARYPEEGLVDKWHGYLLWAVDTSKVNLPNTPSIRECFSVQTNQFPGEGTAQGQSSFVYDVLNRVPVNVILDKFKGEKWFLVDDHASHLHPGVIALYDRGYADYAVAAATTARGAHFVIRMPTSRTFKVVRDFIARGATDEIATICVTKRQKKLALELGWPLELRVRLIRIELGDGNFEVLMTSLLDRGQYPAADFRELYAKRWGVETAVLRFKDQLEAERFSSKKVGNVRQEFHAAVFLLACEAILDKSQDHAVRAESKAKDLKYEYQVNVAEAYASLSEHLVNLFLTAKQSIILHLAAYHAEVRSSKSPIRPNRHVPRPNHHVRHKLNYHMYRRKWRS